MEVAVLSPEQLDERLAHAYEAGYRRAVADGAGDSRSIVPGALYTAQEAAHLLRFGMLVGLDVLNPDDPESGLDMQLIDPLTVFPSGWGSPYGPTEVYRVFEDSNEGIIGAYGGRPGSAEYERIREKVARKATKRKRGNRSVMSTEELRTVTECWNRDWLTVVLDEDVELLSRKHGYRRLPFTIRVGAFDQPAGVSIGSSQQHGAPETHSTDWGDVTISSRSVDLARLLRPYGWKHVWAHRIAEAVSELLYPDLTGAQLDAWRERAGL